MKISMNGRMVDEKKATVSVLDHGLLYGDGVFEGLRVYNNKIFTLDRHIDRLFRSAKALALEIPRTREELVADVIRICKANKVSNGYIRLVVTRGVGTLGLNPFTCKQPQVVIIAAGIQLYPPEAYKKGLSMVTVGTRRNNPEALNPGIKSLNYLNNILAKIEAINAGVPECVMLNHEGFVAEATGDNIFAVKGDTLVTPPIWCGILAGITREVVMELGRELGYTVVENVMTRYDLYTADEVFLTGTAAEIIGVGTIDSRAIGRGRPGPVTKRLAERFHAYTQEDGTPIP